MPALSRAGISRTLIAAAQASRRCAGFGGLLTQSRLAIPLTSAVCPPTRCGHDDKYAIHQFVDRCTVFAPFPTIELAVNHSNTYRPFALNMLARRKCNLAPLAGLLILLLASHLAGATDTTPIKRRVGHVAIGPVWGYRLEVDTYRVTSEWTQAWEDLVDWDEQARWMNRSCATSSTAANLTGRFAMITSHCSGTDVSQGTRS